MGQRTLSRPLSLLPYFAAFLSLIDLASKFLLLFFHYIMCILKFDYRF